MTPKCSDIDPLGLVFTVIVGRLVWAKATHWASNKYPKKPRIPLDTQKQTMIPWHWSTWVGTHCDCGSHGLCWTVPGLASAQDYIPKKIPLELEWLPLESIPLKKQDSQTSVHLRCTHCDCGSHGLCRTVPGLSSARRINRRAPGLLQPAHFYMSWTNHMHLGFRKISWVLKDFWQCCQSQGPLHWL